MTTRDPGASEVFTHGLTSSPRSTAFRASSAAAIITAGLEVFVQLVIAAITTWPLSISQSVPSARVTVTGFEMRSPSWDGPAAGVGMTNGVAGSSSGGSLAGNESADARSMNPVSLWTGGAPPGPAADPSHD